jgi:hypothetical protein
VLSICVRDDGIGADLDDSVGNLGTRDDGVRAHHSVRVLFPDLGDQEGAHTSAGTTTQRVGDLETCKSKIVDRVFDAILRQC